MEVRLLPPEPILRAVDKEDGLAEEQRLPDDREDGKVSGPGRSR
jgi:hypothetical protein